MARKHSVRSSKNISDSEPVVVVHEYPRLLSWVGGACGRVATHPIAFFGCLALVVAALFSYYPSIGGDYDMWFHLAYGKHFVQNLTWNIDHTQFSWTPTIPDWRYVTWIGSGMLYLFYNLLGVPGLYVLQWLIFLAMLAVMFLYLRRLGHRLNLWHIFSFLVMGMVIKLVSMFIKPEMFSTLFFTLTVAIYFFVKVNRRYGLLYLYPALFLVWVNTHGGFIIGLMFISLAFALEVGQQLVFRDRDADRAYLRHFFFAVVLSYLAVQINPDGIFYLPSIIETQLFDQERVKHLDRVFAHFSLWKHISPTIKMYNFVNSALGMLFMGGAFLWIWIRSWLRTRSVDLPLLILNVVFFFFCMQVARAVIFYPPLWFFSTNYLLWKTGSNNLNRRLSFPLLAAGTILSFYLLYIAIALNPNRSYFGVGTWSDFPLNETEYIMKHKLPGPLFNDYLTGGYLMWAMYPKYKVFIDPRFTPYKHEMLDVWFGLGSKYPLTKEGLQALLKDYPFKTAIIHIGERNLIFWFLQNPDWRMVYFDTAAAVLIHKSVVPLLSEEALDTDLAPRRYKDLSNPTKLLRLFDFYVNIRANLGEEIRYIYAKNVSDWFKFKADNLAEMDAILKNKKGGK